MLGIYTSILWYKKKKLNTLTIHITCVEVGIWTKALIIYHISITLQTTA